MKKLIIICFHSHSNNDKSCTFEVFFKLQKIPNKRLVTEINCSVVTGLTKIGQQ